MSVLPTHVFPMLAILFCLALAGVAAGIRLTDVPELSRRIVPFSGGVLIGMAVFWLLPELAAGSGWTRGLAGMTTGFALLWLVDRFLYSVCPSCSHTHDHRDCLKSLHGFAIPLLLAGSLHSFFDGWSIAITQEQASNGLKVAFLAGIGLHKFPEGLALGVLLLAATGSVWKAAVSSVLVQSGMFLGALTAVFLAAHLADRWSGALLSVAAGVFVYLGYHAIEGEWPRERGLVTAFVPALTGAAGAAVLRFVPGL